MCGIAGAVGVAAGDPSAVESQLRTLDHRGPDSWGLYRGRGATLGQTRLRVIDVVTGDPPITDESGDIGVALNGEIYNFTDLRDSLAEAGHRLTTRGDTEVLAHLAEECAPVDLARQLDGMFAFAIWDDRRQRLALGRDRLGEKPLYYWAHGRQLVFGSEIKAVLAHPAVPRRLNTDAIAPYLGFGYVPTPETFFAEIRSLPPGHVLVRDPDGAIEVRPYWEPESAIAPGANRDLTLREAADRSLALLDRAVRKRMVADVPLGAFLSGGIDSSSVVALMARASPTPVRTFTIGFRGDQAFDERAYAASVARHCGTEHTEFVVEPDAVDLLEELVWHHDQPFGDSSALPTYLLSKLTKEQVTVALAGDGGDELFAGYHRFLAALALQWVHRLPSPLVTGARAAFQHVPDRVRPTRRLRRFLASAELPVHHALRTWASYMPDDLRERLLPGSSSGGIAAFDRDWEASAGRPALTRLLLLNLRTYLLDDLLPKVDRMSMAHALEVRSPFLDTELVSFALGLPPELQAKGQSGKRVLRTAIADLVPPEVLTRPKRGFGVPLDRWFTTELRSWADGILSDSKARVRSHLAADAIDDVLAEHATGQSRHGHAIWTLLTLELFLRREGW